MNRFLLAGALLASIGLAGFRTARADSNIPIANAGFESPQTSTYTTDSIPGWTGVGGTMASQNFGVHNFAYIAPDFHDSAPPDGSQFAYINSGSIYQDTGETITARQSYTLTGYICRRIGYPNTSGRASLCTSGGQVLATTGYITAPSGSFTSFSASFTAPPGAPYLGQQLRILLDDTTTPNQQVGFDRLSLRKTTVPRSLITAQDGAPGDRFGWSVAVSGTTMAVGRPGWNGDTGLVDLFVSTGGIWVRQATVAPNDGTPGQLFGYQVALGQGGKLLVVGAPEAENGRGVVYLYTHSGAAWTYRGYVRGSDSVAGDEFGSAVGIAPAGTTFVVGAPAHTAGGAAYVFAWNGSAASQKQKLLPADPQSGTLFGLSMGINAGKVIVVGDPHHDSEAGAIYVYLPKGTLWGPPTKISAVDGAPGNGFGNAVAIAGTAASPVIAAGAHNRPSEAGNVAGAVYLITGLTHQEILSAEDARPANQLGRAVAISQDGTRVAATALGYKSLTGAVYLFDSLGSTNQKLTAVDGQTGTFFGWSLAFTSSGLAIGAPYRSNGDGAVYTTP